MFPLTRVPSWYRLFEPQVEAPSSGLLVSMTSRASLSRLPPGSPYQQGTLKTHSLSSWTLVTFWVWIIFTQEVRTRKRPPKTHRPFWHTLFGFPYTWVVFLFLKTHPTRGGGGSGKRKLLSPTLSRVDLAQIAGPRGL